MYRGKLRTHTIEEYWKNEFQILHMPVEWNSIDIPMHRMGWWENREKFPRCSGLYILEGIREKEGEYNPILRIGIAAGEKGIYGRWFASQAAHYYAWKKENFETSRYARFYSWCATNFSTVRVSFLLYPHLPVSELRSIERKLIQEFSPIWERRDQKGFATSAGSQNGVVP